MNWEHVFIRLAIVFVLGVVVHALYRILTGNSLNDDALWYQKQKREERRRKKAGI
ncbi:hypothetical protein [EBPR podovirus 1]|jgi:multisubunit Na+/H+ antiporter MnhF subunit|nr:hypothetical protein [EBPR podovirus 1]